MPRPRGRPSAVIEYRFRQRFRVPARFAFAWATEYTPSDWRLAGIPGRRAVERLSPTMVRLTDRVPDSQGPGVTKVRVVQLYPGELGWVSTHVSGPCVHSQFRYAITATGPGESQLTFRGREIRWEARESGAAEVARLRSELRSEDVALWRNFARAMEADARPKGRRGARPSPRRPGRRST